MTLDSFLGVAVPIAIFLLLFILVYVKAKKPLDKLFSGFEGDSEEEENMGISYRAISGGGE